ncbi:MAG: hypothetical protein KDE57_04200 [Calditrichaeota bacterium]|nr:hypothetical protein [Calditrichota bacterium]
MSLFFEYLPHFYRNHQKKSVKLRKIKLLIAETPDDAYVNCGTCYFSLTDEKGRLCIRVKKEAAAIAD